MMKQQNRNDKNKNRSIHQRDGKRSAQKRTLPFVIGGILLAAALIAGLLLWLLPAHKDRLVQDNADGSYRDGSGQRFLWMGLSFEPVGRDKEASAVVKAGNMEVDLYRISDMPAGKWYASEDGSVFGVLTKIPSLSALTVNEIAICRDAATVSELGQINKRSNIEAICSFMEEGESVAYPGIEAAVKYVLRFRLGDEYSGLYYKLEYLEYADGVEVADGDRKTYFLYERETGRCVPVDETIHNILEKGE